MNITRSTAGPAWLIVALVVVAVTVLSALHVAAPEVLVTIGLLAVGAAAGVSIPATPHYTTTDPPPSSSPAPAASPVASLTPAAAPTPYVPTAGGYTGTGVGPSSGGA